MAIKAKSRREAKARVFLVEDHPIVSDTLRDLVGGQPDMDVCGIAGEAETAMAAICASKPDMVIVDLRLPGRSGLELIKDIRAQCPRLPVLVLSMYDETLYAGRVLQMGAMGYIMKDEATVQVVEAIHMVLEGQVYISDRVARMMRESVGTPPDGEQWPPERLSDRELEVFGLIGSGATTRQIADRLHLNPKTISAHREHIKKKLGLENAAELTQRAVLWAQSQRGG